MILRYQEYKGGKLYMRWFEASLDEARTIHEAVQEAGLLHMLIPSWLFSELDGMNFEELKLS